MKPPPFAYYAPPSLEEALGALADPDQETVVLAGGQSLVPLLNLRMVLPDRVLDLNGIHGIDRIEVDDDVVRIGALARLSAIEQHDGVSAALPVLGDALRFVAHPQIRNRGTLGGTLCHADPTAEVPVVCVGLGANIELRSLQSSRVVEAGEFFHSIFQTAKRPGELLIAVEFPRRRGFQFGFAEIARRSHADFPYVSLLAGVRVEGDKVLEARLAASGVAERPVRLPSAEQALIGSRLDDDLREVLTAASDDVAPPSDIHGSGNFRLGLLRTLIKRTVPRLGNEVEVYD